MFSKSRVKKLNNRGAGIITVIVAIAFVSVLCSVVLTTSYMNYKMKLTNINSKNNFYSAETALDEISVGLQEIVSDALSAAYLEVLEKYNAYTVDKKNELLESLYYNRIYSVVAADLSYSKYKLDLLQGFVTIGWDNTTNTGCKVTSGSGNKMVTYTNEGIYLKGLEVYYKDSKGYSTTIKTDIKLACPKIDFGAVTAVPDVINFAAISDGTLQFNTSTGVTTTSKGNIYGSIVLAISPSATAKGTVNIESNDVIVAKNDLLITNSIVNFPANDGEIWTTNIVPKSSEVTVNSAINVANDINIKGNGSKLTVVNALNAYGTSKTDADKSSAIVINGTNSELDFSTADMITIAGHAFVNTKAVNRGSVGGTTTGNGNNIFTGESIAIKSNQLMYLVPSECVGVPISRDVDPVTGLETESYGISRFNQNPLTAAQYNELMTRDGSGKPMYLMVQTDKVVASLGNELSKYIGYVGPERSNATPKYETVFVQTSGQTMVYLYMAFEREYETASGGADTSEARANKYFKDYYGNNADGINQYLKYYVSNMEIPDVDNMVRLRMAGNALFYDGDTDTSSLLANTMDDASTRLDASNILYSAEMKALCTKLLKNPSDVGGVIDNDLSHEVIFTNLIDMDFFNTTFAPGEPTKIKFTGDEGVAVITSALNYIYDGSDDESSKDVKLIISSGNVEVNKNFKGLIFAAGNITVKEGKTIEADSEAVSKALWYKNAADTIFAYNFFRDGSGMVRDAGGSRLESQSLALTDLVSYENWSRR